MLRMLTRQVGKRGAGEVYNFPRPTWDRMAVEMGLSLDEFSVPVERAFDAMRGVIGGTTQPSQPVQRRRGRPRKRPRI